jgi:NAD(P)H-nitrite reductase large subunit
LKSQKESLLTVLGTFFFSREKLIKLDTPSRAYDVVVIGEEPHVAYNRVGLTSFFEHQKVEDLYLNPKEWVGLSMN